MSKGKYLLLSFFVLALCLGLCLLAMPVYAGEGYGSNYPGGNEDFMTGAAPPPGMNVFMSYLVDYSVGQIKDNAGRNIAVGGPGGLKLNTDINVLVDALRYIRTTNISLLGGKFLWHVIVPYGTIHVSNEVVLPAGLGTFSAPGTPSTSGGLGDIEYGAGIAWNHTPTLHSVFAFDIVAPTGYYQMAKNGGSGNSSHGFVADAASLGRNYWSFDPLWCVTYLGDKNSPIPGLELSSKFMYWINTVNTATSYVSGQEFMADYTIGYHPNKQWAFGANGFFLYQTTKDTQFGKTAYDPVTGLQTGVEGRDLSIGPAISYELGNCGCFVFKYQRDIWTQNSTAGNKFWLRYIYAWK